MCAIADSGQAGANPRGACFQGADAELLAEGFAVNLTTLRALQQRAGFTTAEVAEALCVSTRTYRRWRQHGNPSPTAVRLLAILAGFVPWPGWDGWEVHRGSLFPPGYSKRGIAPGEFFALVFYRQLVSEQRRRIAALEGEVQALRAELSERAARGSSSPLGRVSGSR